MVHVNPPNIQSRNKKVEISRAREAIGIDFNIAKSTLIPPYSFFDDPILFFFFLPRMRTHSNGCARFLWFGSAQKKDRCFVTQHRETNKDIVLAQTAIKQTNTTNDIKYVSNTSLSLLDYCCNTSITSLSSLKLHHNTSSTPRMKPTITTMPSL